MRSENSYSIFEIVVYF